MNRFTAQQLALLDGLRHISDRMFEFEEKVHPTVQEKYEATRLRRVRRALLLDVEQVAEKLSPIDRLAWRSLARNAGIPSPTGTSKSPSMESTERDYPSNLSADSQPTLPLEG